MAFKKLLWIDAILLVHDSLEVLPKALFGNITNENELFVF